MVRGDWERYPLYEKLLEETEEKYALQVQRSLSKRARQGNIRFARLWEQPSARLPSAWCQSRRQRSPLVPCMTLGCISRASGFSSKCRVKSLSVRIITCRRRNEMT